MSKMTLMQRLAGRCVCVSPLRTRVAPILSTLNFDIIHHRYGNHYFHNYVKTYTSHPSHLQPPNPTDEELDLDKFISTLERVPKQTFGRTFLHAWVQHMIRFPQQLNNVSWPDITRRCIEMDRSIDQHTFSGILLQICNGLHDITVAEEYLKWDTNPSLSALTLHIRTLGFKNHEESRILELYELIKKKNRGIWDFQSGERVITALSKTSKWRDCLDIIKKMEIGGTVPTVCYSFIASAAFDRKEIELGWSLLNNNIKHHRLSGETFASYLRNVQPTEENVVKLLDFMDLYEHFADEMTIQALRSIFENCLGYTGTVSDILPSKATCSSCGAHLEKNALSQAEYVHLVDSFMNKVLQDEDIFLNTTPQELKHFRNFIAGRGPFDYVLDGLNIGYALGRHNLGESAQNLQDLVEQLSRHGSRVLVIGRKHMIKWPRRNMQGVERCATLYLINNNSNDDPFIIYSTLKSHCGAKFVSKDMMRNHTFRLGDPVLARLFKRWRLSNQLTIEAGSGRGVLRTVPFTPILPVPQKNSDSGIWHIPYDSDRLLSPYDLPSKWLCLKPKHKFKK